MVKNKKKINECFNEVMETLPEDYRLIIEDFIKLREETAISKAYETGYEDGTNSGHADVVAYLDSDETDWDKAIEEAISKVREEERERIKKQCLLDTLMGGFNYHWHLKRDWIDREQLIQFLTQKK